MTVDGLPSAPPTLHHLALGARDVEKVAAFYRDILALPEVKRHFQEGGALRSIWLALSSEAVLMIEAAEGASYPHSAPAPGLFLLALRIAEHERFAWEMRLAEAGSPVEHRTAATSYARDPEGNRIALSFHPLGFYPLVPAARQPPG